MMTALATVDKVEINEGMYFAHISCQQQTSCQSCQSQKNCGTGLVSKALGNKTHHWTLHTTQPLQTGTVVEIGLPERNLVVSALIVYLLPLLLMILGALLGQSILRPWLGLGEGIVIVTFFAFGVMGLYLLKPITQKMESKVNQNVSLIRILGQPLYPTSLGS